MELYEDYTGSLREGVSSMFPDAQIPDVKLVRFVLPEEWGHAIADCVTAQGFEATARRDGGVDYGTVPPSQQAQLSIANYICSVQYPVDPRYLRPLSNDQIDYLYGYYTGSLIPCLEDHGYPIELPPSLESFRESYRDQPWSPYTNVNPSGESEWSEINEECPQTPSLLYGKG